MTDGFKEFPKWITTPAGVRMIVQSADEEALHMMPVEEAPVMAPLSETVIEEIATHENALMQSVNRADLLAQAEDKGVKIDRRWSDSRLADEIQKATV